MQSGEAAGWRAARRGRALPMCDVISADIAEQIGSGVLRPGDKLPSYAELGRQYRVSGIVVRNAMAWLRAKGLVVGVPGVGVFIAEAGEGDGGEPA